jgi:hypothetical protein
MKKALVVLHYVPILLCMVWELFRPVGPGLLFPDPELNPELDPELDPAFFIYITVQFRQFRLECCRIRL